MKDIYFDYDKSDIVADQQSSMQGDVEFLKQHPNISFTVEGHCDERGSTEYNLALGDSRANAVRNALIQGRRQRRPHQDHQLRQGKAVLHRIQRELLAAEPPWPLRVQQVSKGSRAGRWPDQGISSRALFLLPDSNDPRNLRVISFADVFHTMNG